MRARTCAVGVALAMAAGAVGFSFGQEGAPPEPVAPASTQPQRANFSRTAEQEILFAEAQLKYNRNELASAEQSFRQLVTEDPGDFQAWYFLGLSQLDQQRPQDAIESFDRALQLDPSLTEVYAARAKAHIQVRNFDAARDDIAFFERDPAWEAQADYLKGQLAYAEGNLEAAAAHFRRAREAAGPEQMSAEFYEGLTYIRMREFVRARSILRESSIGGDADPMLEAASRQLDAVLAATQPQARRPWKLQISAGYEYDTNVVLRGANVALPSELSNEEDGRFVLQPTGSYSFFRTDRMDAGLEASGYFTFQNDITSFNIESYQAGPYIDYRINDNLFASARYGFNFIRFGHEDYLTRHIVTPQVTYVWAKRGYTSLYYQFQHRDFQDAASVPGIERDGTNNIFGIVQGITLPELFKGEGATNLELSYRYDIQSTEGTEYDGDFHAVGLVYYVPLPWQLRADVGATLRFEQYRNDSLFEPGEARDDTELVFTAGVTKRLSSNASLRVDYSFTDRNSNIETVTGQKPFEYDRHVVGIRFIYAF